MSNSKWAALGVALLASTALTTGASAAEWEANMQGGAELGIAYVDGDDDLCEGDCESIGLVNDSSIQFVFKINADNGLQFGYRFDIDTGSGDSAEDDEYYGWVKGSFGTVELGVQDGAYDKLNSTPPGCSFSCPGDGDGYLFDHFNNVTGIDIDGDGVDSGDQLKLTYYTPKFYGFEAGASWIPNANDGEDTAQTDLRENDVSSWEFGARWSGDITDDIDAGIGVVYALGDEFSSFNDEDSWAISGQVGWMDMASIGARYQQNSTRTDSNGDSADESTLSIGADYGTGPWGFFLNWAQTIDSDVESRDGDWGVTAEVDYDLAPGVTVAGIVEFGADEGDTDYDSAFAAGVAMGLSF